MSDFDNTGDDFEDFVRYLEVKFDSPIQSYVGLSPDGSRRYLPISGSNYLFSMEGHGIVMRLTLVAGVSQGLLNHLPQWKQWTEEQAKQK